MTKSLTKRSDLRPTRKGRDYSRGAEELRKVLREVRAEALKPAPRLTLSEWAANNAQLSRDNSAEVGKLRPFGYQHGIMDAMTDPTLDQVTVIKGARLGYTMILALTAGYYSEADPSPVLIVQPTEDDAKDHAQTDIDPLFRNSPSLAGIKNPTKKGDRQDSWHTRYMTNGAILRVRGAVSDDTFRRITTRINIGDEIDAEGWKPGTKTQGDKLKLLNKRGETFWNSKLILGSTPLIKGESRVEEQFQKGDQRRYFVPCPHCGGEQYLKWGGPKETHGMKWELDDNGSLLDVWYECEHCHEQIREEHKRWMNDNGVWRPTATPSRKGHASFHIWTAYSEFPKASWWNLVEEWLEAVKDPINLLQPFYNLVLGETWEHRGGKQVDVDSLAATRPEPYSSQVPDGVLYLTLGADVQSGENARLEYEVVGWGAGEESWQIEYGVIDKDPSSQEAWEALDAVLLKVWRDNAGRQFNIQAACIDSGGHHRQQVYDFASLRKGRRVFAIKGMNTKGRLDSIFPSKPSKGKGGGKVYPICTHGAKDRISEMLSVKEPGPGFMHFPATADHAYFRGLAESEYLKFERQAGRLLRYWKPRSGIRNEPLDCRVYAYAAVKALQVKNLSWDLDRRSKHGPVASSPKAGGSEPEKPAAPEQPQAPQPQPTNAQRRPRRRVVSRSSYVSRR